MSDKFVLVSGGMVEGGEPFRVKIHGVLSIAAFNCAEEAELFRGDLGAAGVNLVVKRLEIGPDGLLRFLPLMFN